MLLKLVSTLVRGKRSLAPVKKTGLQLLSEEFGLPTGGEEEAVAALGELLWREPIDRWRRQWTEIEGLGRQLSRSGAYSEWGASLLARFAKHDPTQLAEGRDETSVFAVLRLLAFAPGAPREWVELVFERLVLPWMTSALQAQRYGLALMLEQHAYISYVMREETEERFRRSFELWTADMRRAGALAGRAFQPFSSAYATDEIPGVAFYLQSGSVLAHTRLLLEFLEAHAGFARPLIRPCVILRGKAGEELARRLRAIDVPCVEVDASTRDGQAGCFQSYLAMRRLIEEDGIAAVVWVSVAVHMAFAFAMRVAPVQIWWALKYHSLELPEADGYVTSGSAGSTKLVAGKLWRSSPLASEDWYRADLAPAAAKVRERYRQHEILFACLGRSEKLNSAEFLAAVAAILHACPGAGFLWTGRERTPEIQARLEELGVAERCHFIGWVDTKLYAQVMDVFLDSFPFPCGFTLYESMAAAKPVVVFASPEARETGLVGLLEPLLKGQTGTADEQSRARVLFGESFGFCAATPAHYVELAVRLAREPQWRQAAGEANRRFVADFLSDRERMARTLATHFVEIIGEARWR